MLEKNVEEFILKELKMKCKHEECGRSEDCGFLEIFKKEPNKANDCSYYRKAKRKEKINNELEQLKEIVQNLEIRKEEKK